MLCCGGIGLVSTFGVRVLVRVLVRALVRVRVRIRVIREASLFWPNMSASFSDYMRSAETIYIWTQVCEQPAHSIVGSHFRRSICMRAGMASDAAYA